MVKPNALWQVHLIGNSRGHLAKLYAPLKKQRGKQKRICVAIGPQKHLEFIADAMQGMKVSA